MSENTGAYVEGNTNVDDDNSKEPSLREEVVETIQDLWSEVLDFLERYPDTVIHDDDNESLGLYGVTLITQDKKRGLTVRISNKHKIDDDTLVRFRHAQTLTEWTLKRFVTNTTESEE